MKYLAIAFLFVACHNGPSAKNKTISNEALDTIKADRPVSIAEPALYESAFIKGTTEKIESASIGFYGITIGKLKISSGSIIVCDPLHIDEYGIPYKQLFPTGEFPVQLSIAALKNEEAIAFARIKFSDEAVVKWELAQLKGKVAETGSMKEIHGYSVDAGVGIFVDQEATKSLDAQEIWEKESEHELFKEMDKHYHFDWRYAMYKFGNNNLAAFSTGLGDGRFTSYIGYDASGKPCRLVTDFGFFDLGK